VITIAPLKTQHQGERRQHRIPITQANQPGPDQLFSGFASARKSRDQARSAPVHLTSSRTFRRHAGADHASDDHRGQGRRPATRAKLNADHAPGVFSPELAQA
jgi:hypothetical protein